MVFVGCSDGGGSKKEVDLTKPDTVLEGAAITLVKIGQETKHSVEGNKYTIAEGSPSGNRVGSAGFGYAFTEEQSEYKYVKLEAKITAIDEDSCAAFTIKKSTQMNDLAGFGGNSSPQYSRNGELNLGDKVGDTAKASEMKGDTFVSDQFLVSLFSGGIYFQFNSYAGYWSNMDGDDLKDPMPDWMDLDIDAKLMGNQSFTVEVTKITFTNGGTPSPDMDLTGDHFSVGNARQFTKDKNGTATPITAVTVTPVGGIFDADKVTAIYYGADGSDDVATATTTIPQSVGVYKVYIDVAKAEGYKAATKLEVGTLTVEEQAPAENINLKELLVGKPVGAVANFGTTFPTATTGLVSAGDATVTSYEITATGLKIIRAGSANYFGLDLADSFFSFAVGDIIQLTIKTIKLSDAGEYPHALILSCDDANGWGSRLGTQPNLEVGATINWELTLSAADVAKIAEASQANKRIRIGVNNSTANGDKEEFEIQELKVIRP